MTNFQEGLHIECEGCGQPASKHRLTRGGTFYCLKYNAEYRWRRESQRAREVLVYTVQVKELVRGRFPEGLGDAINGAIGGFTEQPTL